MKKLLKFAGIGLAVIAVILLLILGYAHGKRFLKRISYKDCPSYIFVVAEFIETRVEISAIQEKINNLKIGDVIVRLDEGNKILILVQNNNTFGEAEHQTLVAVLKELGLQETEMKGLGSYQAKTCYRGDDLIKYIKSNP